MPTAPSWLAGHKEEFHQSVNLPAGKPRTATVTTSRCVSEIVAAVEAAVNISVHWHLTRKLVAGITKIFDMPEVLTLETCSCALKPDYYHGQSQSSRPDET
jgi:hypothetical protein